MPPPAMRTFTVRRWIDRLRSRCTCSAEGLVRTRPRRRTGRCTACPRSWSRYTTRFDSRPRPRTRHRLRHHRARRECRKRSGRSCPGNGNKSSAHSRRKRNRGSPSRACTRRRPRIERGFLRRRRSLRLESCHRHHQRHLLRPYRPRDRRRQESRHTPDSGRSSAAARSPGRPRRADRTPRWQPRRRSPEGYSSRYTARRRAPRPGQHLPPAGRPDSNTACRPYTAGTPLRSGHTPAGSCRRDRNLRHHDSQRTGASSHRPA